MDLLCGQIAALNGARQPERQVAHIAQRLRGQPVTVHGLVIEILRGFPYRLSQGIGQF